MRFLARDETGSALVMALFFITGLALTAMTIVWVSVSEKQTAFNDFSHMRALYASDAGSEQAINWLRGQSIPPAVVSIDTQNGDHLVLKDEALKLEDDQKFELDIKQKLTAAGTPAARPRPGWDESWVDFDYIVDSYGFSVNESNTRVEVQAARLFRVDYAY